MSRRNVTVLPQEGAIVVMPCGPHRILRLSDGVLCAIPVDLLEEQQFAISTLDAQTLLQFRSENAEVVVGNLCDITDFAVQLERMSDEATPDDMEEVEAEEAMRVDEDEQEPDPLGLQVDQVDEIDVTGRFIGVLENSKYGRHSVLVYKIPGQVNCYAFSLHRSYRFSKTYRCIGCKKEGFYTAVKVVGDYEFAEDPCALNHVCLPSRWLKEKSRRTFYEQCQVWKKDGKYAREIPSTEHSKFLLKVNMRQNLPVEEKEAILADHHDYARLRATIVRNMGCERDRTVTMEHIPEALALNPDGTQFLHYRTSGLHIYYSESIIRKALENGLDSLVADGIFGMHPEEKNGQLYTIHGIDVPLLFAITTRKSEVVYRKIWTTLKGTLDSMARWEPSPRIVLDFERASISAVRRVFPGSRVEGCAFHFARALNRKRDELGLRKFIKGRERSRRVKKWWKTLKGVVFLPPQLRDQVPALREVPVSSHHPAWRGCRMFLDYFEETWLRGPFSDMWNKWGVDILRTTNIAETYHSCLRRVLGNRQPALRSLLEHLHAVNARSLGKLRDHEQHPAAEIRLKRRDLRRREKVRAGMKRFRLRLLEEEELTTRELNRFLQAKLPP